MTDLKMAPYMMIRFYKYLTEQYGEQGRNTFLVGFYLYCFRKGICAAQRVVAKGLPMTVANYNANKEGVFVTADGREQAKRMPRSRPSTTEWTNDGYVRRIYSCTTKDAFREFDAPPELESLWCTYVDKLMIQDFDPGIFYEVPVNFLTADYCEHHCMQKGMTEANSKATRTEDAPPLSYLTWRAWASMAQMVESILGEGGKAIIARVKADTIRQYGQKAWDDIEAYHDVVDLDVMYNGGDRAARAQA